MSIHFVDSNVFYYHLLQDRTYGPRATGILNRIWEGENAATSVIVISELVSLFEFRILQARKRKDLSQTEKEYIVERFKEAIHALYRLITTLTYLRKLDCTPRDAFDAFTYRSKYGLNFNDALNVAIMKRNNISEIYSFDKAFDKIPWLKRKAH